MAGFFLSVRLEGVVEDPFICFSRVPQMMQLMNGWHCAWCLASKYHLMLFLACHFCPVGEAAFTACHLVLLCCMCHAIKGQNSSKESFWFWSFIKKNHISKKVYMGMEAKTSALSFTSTYKGASLLNWVTVFLVTLSFCPLYTTSGKKLPTEIGENF